MDVVAERGGGRMGLELSRRIRESRFGGGGCGRTRAGRDKARPKAGGIRGIFARENGRASQSLDGGFLDLGINHHLRRLGNASRLFQIIT